MAHDPQHADRDGPDPSTGPDDEAEIVREIEDDTPASPDLQFHCENCGAEMRWDPDADALHCDYCGQDVPVPRAEGTIIERPLTEADAAARGLGIERRVVRCDTCGATISLDPGVTSDVCVYCGSPAVLEQDANRNAIRPESLIPIDIARGDVERAFRKWVRGLWLRPNALKKQKKFRAVGVYTPFWTYDCRVHSEWSADAGYYYWVTRTYWTTVNGRRTMRTRRVRKVRWVPKWGDRDDAYDDILIAASRGMPGDLIERLGAFDLRALVPYRPEYLAGWRAEEYSIDLADGFERARSVIEAEQRSRCAGDVPGDTHRFLRVANTISGVRWKHVLLPVWSLQYRFGGEVYTVLINGQTGAIVGRAPYSWVKITLLVLSILAFGGVLTALAMRPG